MEVIMMPVIDAFELESAVNTQFGVNIEYIASLLFGDSYNNYSYKSFYFRDKETYGGFPWENEEDIRLRNLVRAYLQDVIPDHDRVLIDVSW